jgi:hypothetical protein
MPDLDSFGVGYEAYDLRKELTFGEKFEPNEGDFEPF